MNESRTSKSIKNAKVSLTFYLINLLVQFWSRKVFFDNLGAEVLGLNTTAMNLLQFLNLAELGISSAVSYSLYKPLVEKDKKTIKEIVAIQGYLYHYIALFVLGAAVLLSFFFPLFFKKVELPLWYAYATFGVFLIEALAGYLFNYRQIVLTADQKDYKLNYVILSVRLIKVISQSLLIINYPKQGYIWWLILEAISILITVYALNILINKEYPWLITNWKEGKKWKLKHAAIITKTKQLFFHKIGGFVLLQTSPLIIYGYTTMTMVAIYGNYILIITGVTALFNSIFYSINAGIGNLIAEGNKEKILSTFRELFSFRFLCVCTVCFVTYKLSNQFVKLWIGANFLLDNASLFILILILYINLMRNAIDSYIYAYGLFQDIYSPIIEAILNITASIILGYYYGLTGVLSGVLFSLVIIVFIWKPYFLFTRALNISISTYILMYIKHFFALIISLFFTSYFSRFILTDNIESIMGLIQDALLLTTTFCIFLLCILYIFEKGMRTFIKKLILIIKS